MAEEAEEAPPPERELIVVSEPIGGFSSAYRGSAPAAAPAPAPAPASRSDRCDMFETRDCAVIF